MVVVFVRGRRAEVFARSRRGQVEGIHSLVPHNGRREVDGGTGVSTHLAGFQPKSSIGAPPQRAQAGGDATTTLGDHGSPGPRALET